MTNWDKTDAAYAFFCEKEASDERFTYEELAIATGYKESTLKSYRTKKWADVLHVWLDGSLLVRGVKGLSLDQFRRRNTQQVDTMLGRSTVLPWKAERLLEKSREHGLGKYLAVSLQCSTSAPTEKAEAMKALQRHEYREISKYIDDYRRELPDDVLLHPDYSFRAFLVLRTANDARRADACVEFVRFDPTSEDDRQRYKDMAVLIKDRHVHVRNKDHMLPKRVVEAVQEKSGKSFSMELHTRAWKMLDIRAPTRGKPRADPRYCYWDEAVNAYLYTPAWVRRLVRLVEDPDELKKLRAFRPQRRR